MAKRHSSGRGTKYLIIALVIAVVLLSLSTLYFFYRAYGSYHTLESHRAYLRQPDAQVQDWMPVRVVTRHFNISEAAVLGELGINQSSTIDRMTIAAICEKQHLDCTVVVADLNAKIHG